MKVVCVLKECNWISRVAVEVEEAKHLLTSHVEENHLPGRPVSPTAVAPLPLAKIEPEVDQQVVEKTPDKHVKRKISDYNSERVKENLAPYTKSDQQQAPSRNMAPLPKSASESDQQQAPYRTMAPLPESAQEEDSDILLHHTVTVDTSRTRQETQNKASKATAEQVQLRDMAALPEKNTDPTDLISGTKEQTRNVSDKTEKECW